MADLTKRNLCSVQSVQELVCTDCGDYFIFGRYKREHFTRMGWPDPQRCPSCRKKARVQREKEAERAEDEAWEQKKAEEQREFDILLKSWSVIPIDEIQPQNDKILYIIGNGFDLMHGVRSSYYAFRDSLGKQNSLREALENHITQDDIWADFENALAHFDVRSMSSRFIIDNWLDIMGAYEKDAGMAEFYMAVEAAINPILTVANDLSRRFRMWVETLSIGTRDRPLRKMFRSGKVLCFNYTEFVENLYGIPEKNICYIHGCRRKKKFHQKDTLILGHVPGASDDAFNFNDNSYVETKSKRKREMIRAAQAVALHLVAESDAVLTKNCREIITVNASFFSRLSQIETVAVIGHSFSPVDWDYFAKVAANLSGRKNAHWYFGCHSLRDLKNLEQMLNKLNIEISNVSVFRTDKIRVTPVVDGKVKSQASNLPKERIRCISPDSRWAVRTMANRLSIIDQEQQTANYEVQFSTSINNAFFFHSGDYLAIIIRGVDSGVFLFRLANGHWNFVNELESIQNQSILNPRLHHVFLTDQDLTFVYNNRVRKYSLSDGALIANQSRRNARNYSYEGKDISGIFLQR